MDNEDSSSDTPLLVKEGQLKKCKMGGKLSNVQWKKYNFSVFNESIHYSKKYDSQVGVVSPEIKRLAPLRDSGVLILIFSILISFLFPVLIIILILFKS